MYLNMKDEQLVLLFTTRLDKVLQNPLKRLAAANRRIWVAFAGLVHSYHHFRKRCVNGYWIHFLHWWARFFCHRVIWQNTFQPQITILKLQLNNANPDIDQETTGIVNKKPKQPLTGQYQYTQTKKKNFLGNEAWLMRDQAADLTLAAFFFSDSIKWWLISEAQN